MQNNPALSMLGIARAAGRLSIGFEATITSVRKKKAHLVIIAADISAKTEKEVRFAAKDSELTIIRIKDDITTLSHAIGIKAGVISVDDEGLAKAVIKRCNDTGEEISL